ncbi:MAG TPA: YceI family protein, partial [Rubrivivax sp.]|nr:YceI family protein [Rubrivivax sp.]
GANRFEAKGTLTVKGVAQEVMVPVTVAIGADSATATGAFQISRARFRIGSAEWADPSLVSDAIEVKFALALKGMVR